MGLFPNEEGKKSLFQFDDLNGATFGGFFYAALIGVEIRIILYNSNIVKPKDIRAYIRT